MSFTRTERRTSVILVCSHPEHYITNQSLLCKRKKFLSTCSSCGILLILNTTVLL